MAASGRTREFTFWRRLMSVALAIVVGLGTWSASSRSLADAGAADGYLDLLAEAADTPRLVWAECGGGFQCATAQVPLDYNRPHDDQMGLSVLKLPASDPSARIGTLFINFGGPGQSGVGRLRDRAKWPWLFSEELRARFDLISWDQRGVARSAAVRCFPTMSSSGSSWFLTRNCR
jgi:pimeloyl-ACP methyl ester carboxylesterase